MSDFDRLVFKSSNPLEATIVVPGQKSNFYIQWHSDPEPAAIVSADGVVTKFDEEKLRTLAKGDQLLAAVVAIMDHYASLKN